MGTQTSDSKPPNRWLNERIPPRFVECRGWPPSPPRALAIANQRQDWQQASRLYRAWLIGWGGVDSDLNLLPPDEVIAFRDGDRLLGAFLQLPPIVVPGIPGRRPLVYDLSDLRDGRLTLAAFRRQMAADLRLRGLL